MDEFGNDPLVPATQAPPLDLSPLVGPIGSQPAAAPPMPPISYPHQVTQDPRQQLLTIAALGAMLGAGPRSGMGAGFGQGTIEAQHALQQVENQHWQIRQQQQQQIAAAQHQANQEAEQRTRDVMNVVQKLKEQGRAAPDAETYAQIASDGSTFLRNTLGVRTATPASVAQMMGPYIPPEHEKRFTDAWDEALKNPVNQSLMEQDPATFAAGVIKVNLGTRTKPIWQDLPTADVADRAGHGFTRDATGKLMLVPKGAAQGQLQREKVLVNGTVQEVLINPNSAAKEHIFGLDGKPIDPATVTAFVPSLAKETDPAVDQLRQLNIQLAQQRLAQGATNSAPLEIKPDSPYYRYALDLAEGRITLPMLQRQLSTRSGGGANVNAIRAGIYNKAVELNPNFNPAQFEMGYKFASNPKTQNQMASINNVLSGVGDLLKASDAATRSGATILNSAILRGGIALGGKRYSNFNTARIAFADELSGALGYGSATDMSREMGFNMTDPNLSPENFRAALEEVVVPFVNRKKTSLLGPMGPYSTPDMNPSARTPTPSGDTGTGNKALDDAAAVLRSRGGR